MTYSAEKTRQAGIRKINLPVYVMLALTLVGILDAMYVAYGSYSGTQLWCPILDGCNTVVNSPYSRVLGMPMSYFGFIYYLFMFGLAARLAYEPASKSLRFRAVLYAALGAVSFRVFYLSSTRPHSGDMQLLHHLRDNLIPLAFCCALALSSDPLKKL